MKARRPDSLIPSQLCLMLGACLMVHGSWLGRRGPGPRPLRGGGAGEAPLGPGMGQVSTAMGIEASAMNHQACEKHGPHRLLYRCVWDEERQHQQHQHCPQGSPRQKLHCRWGHRQHHEEQQLGIKVGILRACENDIGAAPADFLV